jgi:hypothetical protein
MMLPRIFSEVPLGGRILEIPPLAHELGAKRIQEAISLVGENETKKVVKRVGPYLIEEELAEQLKMRGLKLGKGDEVCALSANRWPFSAELPSISGEILGFCLSESEKKTLKSVGVSVDSFEDAIIALKFLRHLFFEQSVKVVMRYTAPSFHQA